jgi:hypothetical protein
MSSLSVMNYFRPIVAQESEETIFNDPITTN